VLWDAIFANAMTRDAFGRRYSDLPFRTYLNRNSVIDILEHRPYFNSSSMSPDLTENL